MALQPTERRSLLQRCFELARRVEEAGPDSTDTDDRDRLLALVKRYEEALERVPLSRCPFSGELGLLAAMQLHVQQSIQEAQKTRPRLESSNDDRGKL